MTLPSVVEIRLEVNNEMCIFKGASVRTKEHFLKKYCFTIIDRGINNKQKDHLFSSLVHSGVLLQRKDPMSMSINVSASMLKEES